MEFIRPSPYQLHSIYTTEPSTILFLPLDNVITHRNINSTDKPHSPHPVINLALICYSWRSVTLLVEPARTSAISSLTRKTANFAYLCKRERQSHTSASASAHTNVLRRMFASYYGDGMLMPGHGQALDLFPASHCRPELLAKASSY